MADVDTTRLLEHLKPVQDLLSRLQDGHAAILRRLTSMSSHLATFHANDAARDVTITEINLRLDRIERRLDLREEA